ncbi:methyltransferase domain-containing protein [Luteococcus sp. OSA5]|uniref:methyltransferase domain-containing protein n=1 Tax=Luteococcus sp. OSA5 TaxID=3401630 RepID=UPI003B438FCD
MPTNPLLRLARRGWLTPMLELGRLGSSAYRVAFRGAGLESGLLREIDRGPRKPAELATRLDLQPDMIDGLASWLDAGVACGDLRRDDQGRYGIRRRSLRKLLTPANDPVAAFTQEMATLHHRLLTETPRRLASGERFGIAEADPAVIARSSRMSEPWITTALERFVPTSAPVRLLEVGCGSGAHIRTAARLNPQLTAVGLELQEPAAQLAQDNISDWGLSDRVDIAVGDIRERKPDAAADLVTLHQNIYYFPEQDQVRLFEHLAGFLAPGGTLLVTTMVRTGKLSSATLDLWGAMTEGCSRLPVPDELVARMREAGLRDARAVKLGSDGLYRAFAARP